MIHTQSYLSNQATLQAAIADLFQAFGATEHNLLSITLFAAPWQDDYASCRSDIASELCAHVDIDHFPLLTFVGQKPLQEEVYYAFEVHHLSKDENFFFASSPQGVRYAVIRPHATPILLIEGCDQDKAWSNAHALMQEYGFEVDDIVRQWNYIGHITQYSAGMQHYQVFNDARSEFYQYADWKNGYPAATGIGTTLSGYVVSLLFAHHTPSLSILPIDNPNQVAAHRYSTRVLEGSEALTTPKFERAKLMCGSGLGICFVSGTAAITGENSLEDVDAQQQTQLTMDHLETLLDESTKKSHLKYRFTSLRIYVKQESDFATIHSIVTERYPTTPALYLLGDVCRAELLVEIEGIAQQV